MGNSSILPAKKNLKFNSSPLENDGWNTILSVSGPLSLFRGELLNFGSVFFPNFAKAYLSTTREGPQTQHEENGLFFREFLVAEDVGVSKNRGTPNWMVYFMENHINIDDFGVNPYFWRATHVKKGCSHFFIGWFVNL